jgi:hypothetical protein
MMKRARRIRDPGLKNFKRKITQRRKQILDGNWKR